MAVDTREQDNAVLKNEISEMRKEALQRIEELNKKMEKMTEVNEIDITANITQTLLPSRQINLSERSELNLLDGTCWKVVFNIGREKGTWMPKTWGASGQRLLLHSQLEFTDQQIYEQEDFLGGGTARTGSKLVRCGQATLGPSTKEGRKGVTIKDGGWRISKGDGPMGTDLLRFYVELEEKAQHQDGDVYIPAGRIYCTCGYFPTRDKSTSIKEALEKDLIELKSQHEKLSIEIEEDTRIISWEKMNKKKQLSDIVEDSKVLKRQISEAMIREPDKSILHMSKDGTVALTKEGGLCCKVQKGVAIEYHILGKFSIAATVKETNGKYSAL